MKNTLYALMLCTVALFTSCSKDNKEVNATTQLAGKWYLKSWTSNNVNGTSTRKDNGLYDTGDYLQFEPGGLLTARVDKEVSQSYWKLLDSDKKLWIADNGILDVPADGYQIQTLNSSRLVLYLKEPMGSGYTEMTIYLER